MTRPTPAIRPQGVLPLMRLIRLVFVCALLSLVAPVTAMAADRMWVGFQDDPSFRWRDDRATMLDEAVTLERRHRPHDGLLVANRSGPAGQPVEPVRPGVPVGRPRRVRPQRAVPRARDAADDLGRRTGRTGARARTTRRRGCPTSAFSRALASRYSGRNPVPVRSASTASGTSPTSSSSSPRRSTARASPWRRSITRSSTEPSTPA